MITSETNDKVVKLLQNSVLAILKSHLLRLRKTLTLCFIENVSKDMKLQLKKNEYQILYKKDKELKGDDITAAHSGVIEYGNDFMNFKNSQQRSNIKYYSSLKIIFQDVFNGTLFVIIIQKFFH